MQAGLVGGEEVSFDASLIKVAVNGHCGISGTREFQWANPQMTTSQVRGYLAALDESEPNGES